jgi:TRAP-type uncharacterized transport system substrate-binding protein
MSKSWMMLTCVLSLGSVGTSQAHPLDSPDIVYIDGLPCNSACQSYMAWSRQTLSTSGHPAPTQLSQRSANEVAHRATRVGGKRLKPAAHARIARQAVSFHREMPRAKVATLQPADNAAARSDVPADKASAAASSSTGTRTIQEQVATALAEHATADAMAQAPEQKSNNTGRSKRSETVPLSDAEKTASTPPNNASNLVALLMARPEIKSVSDLTNKKIAIDDRQSASNDSVRTAIAAAGATEVQLSNGQTRAIDRLISGEVPAAVLTSTYPETAAWFPEIAGFKVFRIPLSPRSLQARLEPAGNAATGPNTRTIQEQVTAATAVAERITVATAVPAPEPKANDKDRSNHSETVLRGDAEKSAPASPNNANHLVALLIARPEIKSVSDLTSKIIAIDDRYSASNGNVRTAIVAAGAAEVQLSDGQTKAINRLISGEVPAAVLALVSPEAAEGFPEVAGLRIFRIPLSPRSINERRDTP